MHLKSIAQIAFSLLIAAFFAGCDDGAYINFYDKNHTKIDCLSYIPANSNKLDTKLAKLYNFNQNCKYKLQLEYSGGIVCNSSYNAPTKATTNFPNAYIRLEVKDGFKTYYSYYKDLNSNPDTSDLERAFDRLQDDILAK
jgi:hypothetical protein